MDATYVFGSIIRTPHIAFVCSVHCQNSSILHSVRSASDSMFGRDCDCIAISVGLHDQEPKEEGQIIPIGCVECVADYEAGANL